MRTKTNKPMKTQIKTYAIINQFIYVIKIIN